MDVQTHPDSAASAGTVMELLFGRWRSQILYAGVKLGVFDALAGTTLDRSALAGTLKLDARNLGRLMRALATIGLVEEHADASYALTPAGELLRADHPRTMRAMTLLEEGPEHYAAWKHLVGLVTDGTQDGFQREFGHPAFEYAMRHPSYGLVFNEAMSSYSGMDNMFLQEALENFSLSAVSRLCDVGGGHGFALCSLLAQHRHLEGVVLDLPQVIAQSDLLWAAKLGVSDRCTYVEGDMFKSVPRADTYMIKRVLHDWDDAQCRQILSTIHRSAPEHSRVLVVEQVIPEAGVPHFSKLFDIHMLIWGTGRERTIEEYSAMLADSGWRYVQTYYPPSKMLGVIEAVRM